jgi:hypothetical protein
MPAQAGIHFGSTATDVGRPYIIARRPRSTAGPRAIRGGGYRQAGSDRGASSHALEDARASVSLNDA